MSNTDFMLSKFSFFDRSLGKIITISIPNSIPKTGLPTIGNTLPIIHAGMEIVNLKRIARLLSLKSLALIFKIY